MTHRHDDADPIEYDPTGMRALLGSLPDPGPMPADLVERITARLADEVDAGSRSTWAPPVAPDSLAAPDAGYPSAPGDTAGTVVPLHRRRSWVLGAAAAAVVVLAAGGIAIDRVAPGGLEASLGLGQGVNDSAASGAESGADAGAAAPLRSTTGMLARDDTLHVVVVASGTAYTASELAVQALPLDAGAMADPLPGTSTIPDLGGEDDAVATPQGARACATAVGVDPAEPVAVDLATFDGRSAAVLVATGPDGGRRAWAVQRSCAPGAADVLDGPVTVG